LGGVRISRFRVGCNNNCGGQQPGPRVDFEGVVQTTDVEVEGVMQSPGILLATKIELRSSR
jgi:hypothetical protein